MRLLDRRRALMAAKSAVPSEWDYVWTSEDGDPAINGWTSDGAGSIATLSTGLRIRGRTFTKDIPINRGSIEISVKDNGDRTTMNGPRGQVRIGNDNNAVVIYFAKWSSDKYLVLHDYSSSADGNQIILGTHLAPWEFEGEYVVRIDMNGATAEVYVNGIMVKDNIDTASMYGKGSLLFGGGSSYYGLAWHYVKYRKID